MRREKGKSIRGTGKARCRKTPAPPSGIRRLLHSPGALIHRLGLPGFVLGLCLLSSAAPLQADPPPKLYFKKQVPLTRDEGVFKYTVQKGEYVYSILRSLDVPEKELPLVAQRLRRLNEHIEDLDRIEPGTRLILPESLRRGRPPSRRPAGSKKTAVRKKQGLPEVEPRPYTVSRGDHLAKILREELNLPDRLIFDEYINLFKELNPEIADINNLSVGQRISLPAPSGGQGPAEERTKRAAAKRDKPEPPVEEGKAAQVEEKAAKELEPGPPAYANKDLVQAMLTQLGFRFAPGKEMLYPFPDQGWLQINLKQMPLARAPWGDSVLFVPDSVRERIQDREFSSAGLKVCVVPDSWEPAATFQALEENSRKKVIFWGRDRSLILNQGHGVLEVLADFLLVRKTGTGKQYYPFHLEAGEQDRPSQLLLAYLAENNVRLFVQAPGSGNRPRFVRHDYPGKDSVFVPSLRSHRAWPDLRAHLGGTSSLPQPDGQDFTSLFSTFRDQGLAAEETYRFHLLKQPGCRITLRMPVFAFSFSETRTLVLSQEQANPYLIALLSLRGYDCLALKRSN